MKEEWKPIAEYEGNVISVFKKTRRLLTPNIGTIGRFKTEEQAYIEYQKAMSRYGII